MKPNRDHACRLFQCLVVAIRPLEVEELAEVLAVDFDDAEGIAKLNPNWRWEDKEQALLTWCSSLIVIVETDGSRVVQFSLFSVKEFLTSTRLADSSKDVSHFHIDLEAVYTYDPGTSLPGRFAPARRFCWRELFPGPGWICCSPLAYTCAV